MLQGANLLWCLPAQELRCACSCLYDALWLRVSAGFGQSIATKSGPKYCGRGGPRCGCACVRCVVLVCAGGNLAAVRDQRMRELAATNAGLAAQLAAAEAEAARQLRAAADAAAAAGIAESRAAAAEAELARAEAAADAQARQVALLEVRAQFSLPSRHCGLLVS